MKTLKKLLFMIIAAALVFALAVPVALGTTPSPDPSATTDPDDEGMPDDDSNTPDDDSSMPDDESDNEEKDKEDGATTLMLNDSGNMVIRVQQRLRDLGYITYRATGQYFSMTETGVRQFQEQNDLDVDGRVGPMTYEKMFQESGLVRKKLSAAEATKNTFGPSYSSDASPGTGTAGDWFTEVDAAFAVGDTVTVTDFNTGTSFKMKRTGGVGHADVEPPDADEYNKYISCFNSGSGTSTNWEKRAVIVTIGSTDYAASIFGNQLGEDTVSDNTMAGHTCLYFSGSVSDVLGFADKEHDKMVAIAAGEISPE